MASTNTASAELRDFHTMASSVSKDIASTSAMLSELSHLVRRQRGLFVDDSDRVNYLVLRIKSNVESLNQRLDEASAVISRQRRRLGKHSQAGQEATNLVGQLREEFVKATSGFKDVLQQRTDRMKDAQHHRRDVLVGDDADADDPVNTARAAMLSSADDVTLSNRPPVYESAAAAANSFFGENTGRFGDDMPDVTAPPPAATASGPGVVIPKLDLASAVMMKQRDAGRDHTSMTPAGEPSGSSLPRPYGAHGNTTSTASMRLRHNATGEPMPYSSTYSRDTPSMTPLTPLDIQQMEADSGQAQRMQLIPDQTYLRERADAMSQVEANIVELGTIFNRLAVMVGEHNEMVQRVEDNVEDANKNVELSLETLMDTLTSLRTNRALFMRVLAVIVIFVVLFVVFFA